MDYKGYKGKVEFDDEAGVFHGQVLNLRDVITFQGTTVDELRLEFEASVDDYLEWCAERGEAPEKPFSGKFMLRLEPDLHRDIAIKAELEDKSLNTWVSDVLSAAVRDVPSRPVMPETLTRAVIMTAVSQKATTEPLTLTTLSATRTTHRGFGERVIKHNVYN